MAANISGMFSQLNNIIGQHPANANHDFSVEGMAPSPMDSVNPMLQSAVSGFGGALGVPKEQLATSQQKQAIGQQGMAEAMQSNDPQVLRQAGAGLIKLGMVEQGALLIQRADAMSAKQTALLDEGQKEIDLGVEQAKKVQGSRMATSMALQAGDKEAADMISKGLMTPQEYMKARMEARKGGEPVSVANGAMLVDPKTGKVIANNPKTFNPSSGSSGSSGGSKGEGDYSVYDSKTMDTSATAVQELTSAATRAESLAEAMKTSDVSGGFLGATGPDWLATQLGNRSEVQKLRTQAMELKNNKVVASLPKGPASDRDIEITSRGFPPDNAEKQEWVEFLVATSRVQRKVAEFEQMKYDYIREGREGNLVADWKAKAEQIAKKEYIDATPVAAYEALKANPSKKNKAKFLAKYHHLPEGI